MKEIMVTVIKSGASKEDIDRILESHSNKKGKKGIDVKKYCGILDLKEDPLELQKKWRNEWE
jgi:hypothetical protein